MRLRKKKSLIEQAREQATEYVETVRPQVEQAVASARAAAVPVITEARDKAAPVLAEARERAMTGIADARERTGPALVDAKAKAAPLVAAGAAKATERAHAGKQAAGAKIAALKGEPPKKKGGKLKKVLLFGAVAGLVGFVAKKLQGGSSSDNWQSSYTPTPAPAPTPASPMPVAEDADDTGGSSPDEAIADRADAPHGVTTPDDPAEVVAIDDEPKAP